MQHFIWKSGSLYGNASAAITNATRKLGIQKDIQSMQVYKVEGYWTVTIEYI